MNPFDKNARLAVIKEATESARQVMPIILKMFNPSSILDVGCAEGVWAAEAIKAGWKNVRGCDDKWVSTSGSLLIPNQNFFQVDLEKGPLPDDSVSMALCLEVAEHLSPKAGQNLVKWLSHISSGIVVFSAAIPRQGGVGHINEQWQSYWAELFHAQGMYPFAELREAIWNLPGVQPYYKSNIMVYKRSQIGRTYLLNVVHPDMWSYKLGAR